MASAASGPFEFEIDAGVLSEGLIEELKAVLEHHRGEAEVRVAIRNGGPEPRRFEFGEAYRVRPSAHLRSELDHVLGNASALAA